MVAANWVQQWSNWTRFDASQIHHISNARFVDRIQNQQGEIVPGSIQWLGGSQGAFGVPIFPTYSLLNGEPRSYQEFPNHWIRIAKIHVNRSRYEVWWVAGEWVFIIIGRPFWKGTFMMFHVLCLSFDQSNVLISTRVAEAMATCQPCIKISKGGKAYAIDHPQVWGLPSGKGLHIHGLNHHAINGKTQ